MIDMITRRLCILPLLLLITSVISAAPDRISDGVDHRFHDVGPSYLRRPTIIEGGGCEETYGFLPCTTNAAGNLCLIVVYGYVMFLAADFLSDGSERLLEVLGPGLVGGLLLPLLRCLPDAMLILVSGLSGSKATAQEQVSVGIGLLTGSTVMLLTVIWGTCVVVGKCDLEDSLAVELTDTKGFDLRGSGVSTDLWTSYAARIMAISVLPFLVVQLPQALDSSLGRQLAVLIALIISLLMLISYCLYQVFQPWIQERRIDYVKHKHKYQHKHSKKTALGRLCNHDGSPNNDAMAKLFKAIDLDVDDHLSKGELRAFLVGMQFEGTTLGEEDIVRKVMKEFDSEIQDVRIDKDEFIRGISKLLNLTRGDRVSHHKADTTKYLDAYDEEAKIEHSLLGDSSDEASEVVENPKKIIIKAILFLVLGTIIAIVFADPLVDAVENFSNATSIPSFFLSFIALPFVTISSESVSVIISASKKERKSTSLTFFELYGAVTMNNFICLSVFLALVYVRGLTWDFSSEVLIVFLVCVIMGALGSFRTVFPLWTAFVAFLLYPSSLVLLYSLGYILGWS